MEKEEEASFHSRVVAWGGVVKMIGDYPLLGAGQGTFPTIFTQYQPPGLSRHFTKAHNDYPHFISEVGLPLIVILAWIIIAFYKRGFYKLRYPSRLVRGTTLGAMSGVTAILFDISDFNLHIPCQCAALHSPGGHCSRPITKTRECISLSALIALPSDLHLTKNIIDIY